MLSLPGPSLLDNGNSGKFSFVGPMVIKYILQIVISYNNIFTGI